MMLYRPLKSLLYFIQCIAVAGCVFVPTVEYGLLVGRGEISDEQIATIIVGKTSADDLMLKLGSPDGTIKNKSIFMYTWGTVAALMVTPHSDAPFTQPYLLLIQMDNNIVKRFQLLKVDEIYSTNPRAPVQDAEIHRELLKIGQDWANN